MKEKLNKEISKQKWAIIIAVVLITSIWAGVLTLEYKISQNKNSATFIKLEKDLCLYLPLGCQSTETKNELLFYCKTGTTGKLAFDYRDKIVRSESQEVVRKVVKGNRSSYFLEVKVYENNNADLGKVISCPN